MIKVYCTTCKKEIKVYPYRLKITKDFYCKDHIKEAWNKYRLLGRETGGATISKLAKEGKLPEGIKKALEKGRYKGKKCSKETRQKLSIAGKNRILSPEAKQRMIEGARKAGYKAKGKILSIETRKKISKIQMGKKINDNQRRGLLSGWIARKGFKASEETKRKLRISHLGHKQSEQTKEKRSIAMKKVWLDIPIEEKNKLSKAGQKRWLNSSYRKRVLGKRFMSGLEIKVQNVIQKHNLPYKFVGNGDFFIERKCPDFININGEKKAIEVYWNKHKEQFAKGGLAGWRKERIEIFNKYGWEIIFIEGTGLTNQTILNLIQKGGD